MIFRRFFLSLILSTVVFGGAAGPAWAQPVPAMSSGATLTEAQWLQVQARLEAEISTSLSWLKDYQTQKAVLDSNIADLQSKTAELRSELRTDSNVFKEIRLKELLNELKDKLEENSKAEREADTKQKEFEQKCIDLSDLYNNHIELLLTQGDVTESGAALDAKVNEVTDLARKRNRVQTLLSQYRQKDQIDEPVELNAVAVLKTNDRETLQLTMDLFRDRQKNIQTQIQKWSLEMDSIHNELKLQGEMRDFLKDVHSMNADSNFPQNDLKQEDLEFLSTDVHKKKLNDRLNEVQQKILQGQKELAQIDILLTKVKGRLDRLSEGKQL